MGRVRVARVTLFPSATFVFYLATPTVSNPQSTCNQRDVLILQPLPVALPRVLLFSTFVLYSSLIKNKSHTQHTTTAAVKLPPQTPKQRVAVEHMDVVSLSSKAS